MKRYNDFLIVGIDHGYGNIKTANTVTPTGIVSEVGKAFIAEMPKFLASLMLSLNRGYPMQAVPVGTEDTRGYAEIGNPSTTEGLKTSDEDDYSGIDFDFIGG